MQQQARNQQVFEIPTEILKVGNNLGYSQICEVSPTRNNNLIKVNKVQSLPQEVSSDPETIELRLVEPVEKNNNQMEKLHTEKVFTDIYLKGMG
jgi:uncharacterized membrane protein YjjP (DUF1212 family)